MITYKIKLLDACLEERSCGVSGHIPTEQNGCCHMTCTCMRLNTCDPQDPNLKVNILHWKVPRKSIKFKKKCRINLKRHANFADPRPPQIHTVDSYMEHTEG